MKAMISDAVLAIPPAVAALALAHLLGAATPARPAARLRPLRPRPPGLAPPPAGPALGGAPADPPDAPSGAEKARGELLRSPPGFSRASWPGASGLEERTPARPCAPPATPRPHPRGRGTAEIGSPVGRTGSRRWTTCCVRALSPPLPSPALPIDNSLASRIPCKSRAEKGFCVPGKDTNC